MTIFAVVIRTMLLGMQLGQSVLDGESLLSKCETPQEFLIWG